LLDQALVEPWPYLQEFERYIALILPYQQPILSSHQGVFISLSEKFPYPWQAYRLILEPLEYQPLSKQFLVLSKLSFAFLQALIDFS
jgi:hypothetical protein